MTKTSGKPLVFFCLSIYNPYMVNSVEVKKIGILIDKNFHGSLFLSEITDKEILIFSEEKFTIGQKISIELSLPKPLSLNAIVERCVEYNMGSKIIFTKKQNYRLKCQLTFDTPDEQTQLQNFLQSINGQKPKKREPLKLIKTEHL